MSAEPCCGSSDIASGLERLLHGSPSALDSWPPAQAQQGREALNSFALELAAMTAPWPILADAPVLASLPPQKRRALLDEGAHHSGRHLSSVQCTGLLAACMAAMRNLRRNAPQTGGGDPRRAMEGSGSSSGEFSQSPGPSTSGSSTVLLGQAVMLHAAITSQRCGDACSLWPGCGAAPDPFHNVPASVAALLDAASQAQVEVQALSAVRTRQEHALTAWDKPVCKRTRRPEMLCKLSPLAAHPVGYLQRCFSSVGSLEIISNGSSHLLAAASACDSKLTARGPMCSQRWQRARQRRLWQLPASPCMMSQ